MRVSGPVVMLSIFVILSVSPVRAKGQGEGEIGVGYETRFLLPWGGYCPSDLEKIAPCGFQEYVYTELGISLRFEAFAISAGVLAGKIIPPPGPFLSTVFPSDEITPWSPVSYRSLRLEFFTAAVGGWLRFRYIPESVKDYRLALYTSVATGRYRQTWKKIDGNQEFAGIGQVWSLKLQPLMEWKIAGSLEKGYLFVLDWAPIGMSISWNTLTVNQQEKITGIVTQLHIVVSKFGIRMIISPRGNH